MSSMVPRPKPPVPGRSKKPSVPKIDLGALKGQKKNQPKVKKFLLPGEELGRTKSPRSDFMDLSNQNTIYKTY